MSSLRLIVVTVVMAAALTALVVAVRPGPVERTSFDPGFGPGPVEQGTPVTPEWAAAQADLEVGVASASPNPCRNGDVETCFAAILVEMDARLDRLGCSHAAPFAFTYLEMTRGVADAAAEPGFFRVPAGVANIDAIFAQLYFDAFDNWEAGRLDHVPGAWQMAFEAADRQSASAAADLLLGINAHITRDLAYAVAMVLGADGDLSEDPEDFVRINEVIAEVRAPMLAAASRRFDPALADLDIELDPSLGLDTVDLIGRWRDEAFELGERLARASGDTERLEIVAAIERNAVAGATLILNANATMGAGSTPDERLAHCERAR